MDGSFDEAKMASQSHISACHIACPPTRRQAIHAATNKKVKKVNPIKNRSVKSRCFNFVNALDDVRNRTAKGPWYPSDTFCKVSLKMTNYPDDSGQH